MNEMKYYGRYVIDGYRRGLMASILDIVSCFKRLHKFPYVASSLGTPDSHLPIRYVDPQSVGSGINKGDSPLYEMDQARRTYPRY